LWKRAETDHSGETRIERRSGISLRDWERERQMGVGAWLAWR